MMTDSEPRDVRFAALRQDALGHAVAFGGQAPSIHNSQPWRWRISEGALDLMLEPRRLLLSTDPDSRLAILSCGIALHHARLQLAALGWAADVDRTPMGEDGETSGPLARIRLGSHGAADPRAVRLVRAGAGRRTDRRTSPSAPLDFDRLRSIADATRTEGADLRFLHRRQLFDLAAAVEKAQQVEREDAAWQVELEAWLGGRRPSGTGIPSEALPADPYQLVAPGRALRRAGTALVADAREQSSVFGVLSTAGDDRADWLRAGEGLSACWLTATDLDVSVLPLSIVTEVATSRDMISNLIGWRGYPHLVLRFAVSPAVQPDTRTPRLPFREIVEYE